MIVPSIAIERPLHFTDFSRSADTLVAKVDTVREFDEDAVINYVQYNCSNSNSEADDVSFASYNCTFNAIEAIKDL